MLLGVEREGRGFYVHKRVAFIDIKCSYAEMSHVRAFFGGGGVYVPKGRTSVFWRCVQSKLVEKFELSISKQTLFSFWNFFFDLLVSSSFPFSFLAQVEKKKKKRRAN
jgi:hypothetical protein